MTREQAARKRYWRHVLDFQRQGLVLQRTGDGARLVKWLQDFSRRFLADGQAFRAAGDVPAGDALIRVSLALSAYAQALLLDGPTNEAVFEFQRAIAALPKRF